jgi:hypothetical protein
VFGTILDSFPGPCWLFRGFIVLHHVAILSKYIALIQDIDSRSWSSDDSLAPHLV